MYEHMVREVERVWADTNDIGAAAILRASISFASLPVLDWLSSVLGALRFYGATRDRTQPLEVGGMGIADEASWTAPVQIHDVFRRLQHVLNASADGIRYFGGVRFAINETPDQDWQSFGTCRFVVPRYELLTSPAGSQLSFHFKPSEMRSGQVESLLEPMRDMSFEARAWSDAFPPPLGRTDTPDRAGWERNIAKALEAFKQGDLEKIVLARKAVFECAGELDPVTLMHRLKSATPDCFHFCYMPTSDVAFVGASPERLYRREECRIETEAVAGTRMRDAYPEEDKRLGRVLLESEKDQREHAYVRDGIRDALQPLCDTFEMDESPSLLKLARGQHLYTAVRGTLRENMSDADIVAALHPTPAIGGTPTERALQRIAEWEPFDRGWYAAPVGWVSRDAAEFAVAIRSGLVRPGRLSLFSGAGIVEGSTAENEWEEIELKIRDFIKVLTGP